MASLNLSTLDGTSGFKLSGAADGDSTGFSVSSAGDVNRDGFDDLIIGASGADPNGSYSGTSYVVFGKASGFAASLNLSTLDGSNGFKLSGVAVGDFSGTSVSGAGDVNGDGFGDIIIGASGASFVVFGGALEGLVINDVTVVEPSSGTATASFTVTLLSTSAETVTVHCSTANGTATAVDDYMPANGSTLTFAPGETTKTVLIPINADSTVEQPETFVVNLSNAINATLPDPQGVATILEGTSVVYLSTLDGNNGFKLSGVAAGDASGTSVSGAGDVNGDGFGDLIIGAPDFNGSSSGASYVVFGKASGFSTNLNLSTLDGSNGFKLTGVAAADRFGSSPDQSR